MRSLPIKSRLLLGSLGKAAGTATSRGALTPAAGDLSRGEGIFCDPELEDGGDCFGGSAKRHFR